MDIIPSYCNMVIFPFEIFQQKLFPKKGADKSTAISGVSLGVVLRIKYFTKTGRTSFKKKCLCSIKCLCLSLFILLAFDYFFLCFLRTTLKATCGGIVYINLWTVKRTFAVTSFFFLKAYKKQHANFKATGVKHCNKLQKSTF